MFEEDGGRQEGRGEKREVDRRKTRSIFSLCPLALFGAAMAARDGEREGLLYAARVRNIISAGGGTMTYLLPVIALGTRCTRSDREGERRRPNRNEWCFQPPTTYSLWSQFPCRARRRPLRY